MKSRTLALSLLLSFSVLGGCTAEEDTPSKRDAAIEQRKSDAIDHCSAFGWYDDGVCDSFCVDPDPDCTSECPDPNDATVHYISHEASECAASLFMCADGEESFDDECGCGCIGERACPDSSLPNVWYASHDPGTCAASLFACEEGETRFDDECGCGCIGQ